jgi:alpha-L-arabinofuranosidase
MVNATDQLQHQTVHLDSKKKVNAKAMLTILKSGNLEEVNSLDMPLKVSPVEKQIQLKGKTIAAELEPYSFSVIRVKVAK